MHAHGCIMHVQVLPPGEKKTQKVAVGDCSGVIQCFSIKRGDVALSFKTMPSSQKVIKLDPTPSLLSCPAVGLKCSCPKPLRSKPTDQESADGASSCMSVCTVPC